MNRKMFRKAAGKISRISTESPNSVTKTADVSDFQKLDNMCFLL